jgi:hypothetical protein
MLGNQGKLADASARTLILPMRLNPTFLYMFPSSVTAAPLVAKSQGLHSNQSIKLHQRPIVLPNHSIARFFPWGNTIGFTSYNPHFVVYACIILYEDGIVGRWLSYEHTLCVYQLGSLLDLTCKF